MDLDKILHDKKNFAELGDDDVERFLHERTFRTEQLNLEFKTGFPRRNGGKYDIRKICKYIAGFSNEQGGLVVYGVTDDIKDPGVEYPDYVPGLTHHPTREDLSQWVNERIYPLVQSPAIRDFEFNDRKVVIIKVPAGINRPYTYYDPSSKTITIFKKTAGGIVELAPDQVREFYRSAMLDQAARLLRAAAVTEGPEEGPAASAEEQRLAEHKVFLVPKLEDVEHFGYVGMYCVPDRWLDIPIETMKEFVTSHRGDFSEAIRFFRDVDVFQNGVSVGYFPRAVSQDVKSTNRLTLYRDGLVAYDSQADSLMDRDSNLHPYWLAYEIQRHLQTAKALLQEYGVETMRLVIRLEHIDDFYMKFSGDGFFEDQVSQYTGGHEPIVRAVQLADVHDYDGDKRNIIMPVVEDVMDEVARIFGFSKSLSLVGDDQGTLTYVKGLENQR